MENYFQDNNHNKRKVYSNKWRQSYWTVSESSRWWNKWGPT